MTLDPDVARLLADDADDLPLESIPLEEARAATRGVVAVQGESVEVADVRDVVATGEGGPIRVRLYYPPEAAAPAPVLVWMHGGGWIRGDLDTWDTPLKGLSRRVGAVVASVDYRWAPETRFPGPLHDVLSALRHLAEHAEDLGLDAASVAIGGDSAGGNLAAGAALAARDLEPDLSPVAQVLAYPATDPGCATESCLRYDGYALTRDDMRYLWGLYLPTPYAGDHPYAAPLRARDLSDLPPAVIATAEYDPLRDDGERYAARLATAGVPVRLRRFDGMIHSFLHHAGRVPAARALPEWLGTEIRPLVGTDRLPSAHESPMRIGAPVLTWGNTHIA